MDTHERGYRAPDDGELGPTVFETGDPSPHPVPVAQNVTGPFEHPVDVPAGSEHPAGEGDEEAAADAAEAKKAAAAAKKAASGS